MANRFAEGRGIVHCLEVQRTAKRSKSGKRQDCAAICRRAFSNVSAGCPPEIRYCSLITIEGTALIGTPGGIGAAMDPRKFLQAGDVVRCEIERIGAIEATMVAED